MWSSSLDCTSPWRSISAFISSSDIGSANFALISSYSLTRATVAATPSSTHSRTVFAGSSFGSCSRNPKLIPGVETISPLNSLSAPAMIRSSELLPEPLRPSTPILAP